MLVICRKAGVCTRKGCKHRRPHEPIFSRHYPKYKAVHCYRVNLIKCGQTQEECWLDSDCEVFSEL